MSLVAVTAIYTLTDCIYVWASIQQWTYMKDMNLLL